MTICGLSFRGYMQQICRSENAMTLLFFFKHVDQQRRLGLGMMRVPRGELFSWIHLAAFLRQETLRRLPINLFSEYFIGSACFLITLLR
jgi:hypothetical protein